MFLTLLYIFIFVNFCWSLFLACFTYKNLKGFYKPCTYKKPDGTVTDLHKEYDVFHPHDKFSFLQLFLGYFLLFPIKYSLSWFIAITMNLHLRLLLRLYPNTETDPKQWVKMKNAISFWSTFFLYVNGIRIVERKKDCTELYKKYLGPDYDFKNQKFSLLISNHIGFFEVVAQMARWSAGFMAKDEVANYFFVGPISQAMHCLFVNRREEATRKYMFEQLEERQKLYYEGKFLAPLAMFPEGTTTCGRNILKFKKGSFFALLPVKPSLFQINQNSSYHLSVGAMSVVQTYIRNYSHTIENLYVTDMPVIRPTEYMFEHYKDLGNEKWEIYAEVCRKIIGELGGLIESDLRHRDELKYAKACKTGIYDPNEDVMEECYGIDTKKKSGAPQNAEKKEKKD